MATNRTQTILTAQDRTQAAFRSVTKNLATVEKAFINVGIVSAGLATIMGGIFVRRLVETNKSFESLQASLITFTGSAEKAKGAFLILQDFAKTTPFSLQEVVEGFNVMVARGIRPTEKQLRKFADIAGGMSKPFIQFAEAIADATTGEFERLKEFGIKASKEGEKITLSFDDLTMTVGNNAEEITAALEKISQIKFAGGAERQAQTLGGSFTNLTDNIDAFMMKVGEAGLNKELSNAAKAIANLTQGNESLARAFSNTLVNAMRVTVAVVRFLIDNLQTLGIALGVIIGAKTVRGILNLAKAMASFAKVSILAAASVGKTGAKFAIFGVVIASLATGIAVATGKFNELVNAIKNVAEKMGITNFVQQKFAEIMNILKLEVGSVESQLKALGKTGDEFTQSINQNNSSLSDFIGKTASAKNQIDLTKTSLGQFTEANSNLANNLDNVGVTSINSMENALLGIMNGTMSAKDAFKNMASSIINDIMRMVIRMQIAVPIANALNKALGGAFSSPTVSAPTIQSGALQMGELASGGPAMAGRPYIVGEKGPEIMVPNRSGTVIPNHAIGGGVVINQTLHIETGVAQTVRAEIAQLMPQIADNTKAAVLDARRRGGSFANGFA
jgi:methyl-accepting chemotaxis protein